MNASTQSFSNNSNDADVTAKLPVLDVAAYEARPGHDPLGSTDTWAEPTLNTAILSQLQADGTPEPAQPAIVASKIEAELKSLHSNLSELETRLAAKGERLRIIEAELAESRIAGQAAAAHALALAEELNGNHAAVAAATTQIDDLHATIRTHEEVSRVAAERETELRQLLARREAEFAGNAVADASRITKLAASHDAAVHAAQQRIAQLQTQSIAQLEILQSMEGRRGIFDSVLRTLDLQIVDRDQEQARLADDLARNTTHGLELTRELDSRARRVAQLEAEVMAVNSKLGVHAEQAGALARANSELMQTLQGLQQESAQRAQRVTELEAQIVAAKQAHTEALQTAAAAHGEIQAAGAALTAQKSALEAELTELREQSEGHVAAVQQIAAEHANRLAQIEARDAQVAALTAQGATQAQTIHSEIERNRLAEERIAIAENDQRAADAAIERLESEVRSRSMRVEELTRINSQMQTDIADAKRWLDERDALMQRLETEAAHSATVVDNIQRSIRSLAPGSTGNNEVIREAGTHLLVQSQDGHEEVHVLGRKTTIGRTPDNDLQIDASFISRHHAVLLSSGQQTIIEDLNSTNGVFVNGHRIDREFLNDGDLVMVGKARFRFAIRAAVDHGAAEPSA